MKKIWKISGLCLALIMAMTGCDDENENAKLPALTMTWEANPDFAQMDITDNMNVKITIDAPTGIKTFVVDVESDVLNNMMHITQIDLVNPAEDIKAIVESLIWVDGKSPVDQTSYTLDLSALVPLINGLTTKEGLHTFTVTITDNADQSFTQSCVFRRVADTTPTVSDVNLWANSATVTIPSTVTSVSYREQGTEEWIPAEASGDGTWKIAPVWEKPTTSPAKNGNVVYQAKAGTGVFAGKTYDLLVGEKEYPAKLVCNAGDAIPNGDMTDWSTNNNLPSPNKEGESFWGCGNNPMANLCIPDTLSEENVAAHLKPYTDLATMGIFGAGNLFTGDFQFAGFSGSVNFGKPYVWTARPKALRVIYKGTVGEIKYASGAERPLIGSPDTMRIYVAVVDWNAQHNVAAGMGAAEGTWDPCTMTSVEEGAILGFASLAITENQEDFTTVEIPFYWYDTAAKPADGNFSLVISCATSNRGDYFTGGDNEMWIDKFEWVY